MSEEMHVLPSINFPGSKSNLIGKVVVTLNLWAKLQASQGHKLIHKTTAGETVTICGPKPFRTRWTDNL